MSLGDLEQCDNGSEFVADLCVIGTGAAGITVAMEFRNSPYRVLLLEAGHHLFEPQTQQLYAGDMAGLPFPSLLEGRARTHGGTTTLWAGQAARLQALDFEPRDWVPHSGWPISRAELEPYYPRAENMMGLGPKTYDEASWPQERKLPTYDPSKLCFRFSQFATLRHRNFATAYARELKEAANVELLFHANVVSLDTNPDATHVERVRLKTLGGKTGTARAKYYLLCAGGIETARLLLASNRVEPHGLGNRHDLVGRYFQDHIHALGAIVTPHNRKSWHGYFDPFYHRGIKYCPKIAASERLQRSEKILNIAAEIVYETAADSPVEAAKLLLRAPRRRELWGKVPKAILNIIKRPHELAATLYRYGLLKQTVSSKRGVVYLGTQSEASPNPHSRVRLGDQVDPLGMRRSVVEWRLTELDRRTIDVFVGAVEAELKRLGLGRIDVTLLPAEFPAGLGGSVHEASHHMGTTRMHDDLRYGVVDRHCQVHGVANLYVGSSAVFPTGGFSNPTLTMIALCQRICDRLKRLLA
jgi:choline dehydrogenase-like flavoprotein